MAYILSDSATFSGIGIHSGKTVTLTIHPSEPGSGIVFRRIDINHSDIPVRPEFVEASFRFTTLKKGDTEIHTPEHLLSALYALGIYDAIIDIDSAELPILDGSAKPYIDALKPLRQESSTSYDRSPIVINDIIRVDDGDKTMMALPASTAQFSFLIDYPTSFVGVQFLSIPSLDDYETDIAAARTYGFEAEVKALLDQNLARGGSLENAVVIGDTDYLNPLRFDNELVRHKILDLIGDMSILGRPIQGHIIGIRSGHAMAATFSKMIAERFST